MRARLAMSLLAFALAAGGWLHAQPSDPRPGYYAVEDSPDGKPLPVYLQPDPEATRIGVLPAGTQPVEVVEVRRVEDQAWGLVFSGEGAGWLPMYRLRQIELEGVLDTLLPVDARCSGTEPFWGMRFEQDAAVFSEPLGEQPRETRFEIDAATVAAGRFYPLLFSFADGAGYALAEPQFCSDGMSDIPYGWALHLILTDESLQTPVRVFSGCCRVWPEVATDAP